MRLQTRIRSSLSIIGIFALTASAPALAAAGISISFENMFVPLGKKVEKVYDGKALLSASHSPVPPGSVPSANPSGGPLLDAQGLPVKDAQGNTIATGYWIPPVGASAALPGRETAEWVGLSAFVDLNRNWRLLGGAHTTLMSGRPLFKLDTSLAYMLPVPDVIPVQPYLYLGATPVISAVPDIPTFGLNLHTGLGIDYVWQNTLYTHIRANIYMVSVYGEKTNQDLNLHWLQSSFSISAGMGYLF